MDIFIKNITGHILVGKVFNKSNKTVFPDFTNPKGVKYWHKMFAQFHKKVAFDGSWNDENEVSMFIDGSLDGCPDNNVLESPQYVPGGNGKLKRSTLCMTAK